MDKYIIITTLCDKKEIADKITDTCVLLLTPVFEKY